MQHQTSRPIRTRRLDSGIWGARVKLPEAGQKWSVSTLIIATVQWPDGSVDVSHCTGGTDTRTLTHIPPKLTHTRIPAHLARRGAYLEER